MCTLNVSCIFVCAITKAWFCDLQFMGENCDFFRAKFFLTSLWLLNYKNYLGSHKAQDSDKIILMCESRQTLHSWAWTSILWFVFWSESHNSQYIKMDPYRVKNPTFWHKSTRFLVILCFEVRVVISSEFKIFWQVSDFFPREISWDVAEHELLMQKYTKSIIYRK